MLSFQDILSKTTEQRRRIRESLDHVNNEQGWHPQDSNLYEGLNAADTAEVKAALDSMTLAEVLEKGSTAMGADTLVATKLHDTLIYAARPYDICPEIGYVVNKWEGGNLDVNITVDGSYIPKPFVGGKLEVNASFVKATVAPVAYGIPILAGEDMIEDQEYSIVQWHVEHAAQACGEQASELAIAVLKAAADGDGVLNTEAATLNAMTETDVSNAKKANGTDGFTSNTFLISDVSYAPLDVGREVAGGAAGDYYVVSPATYRMPAEGFNEVRLGLDVLLNDSPLLKTNGTNAYSVVFDRNNALLTGRKRWLELKNFSNPIEDIAGAVVSFRQDSVSLYKDAICLITES